MSYLIVLLALLTFTSSLLASDDSDAEKKLNTLMEELMNALEIIEQDKACKNYYWFDNEYKCITVISGGTQFINNSSKGKSPPVSLTTSGNGGGGWNENVNPEQNWYALAVGIDANDKLRFIDNEILELSNDGVFGRHNMKVLMGDADPNLVIPEFEKIAVPQSAKLLSGNKYILTDQDLTKMIHLHTFEPDNLARPTYQMSIKAEGLAGQVIFNSLVGSQ